MQAVLAPLGAFGINLAAMTADDLHRRRGPPRPAAALPRGVWAGVFYLCVGLLGASVALLLTAMPHALVLAVAGVGPLTTIEASLASALPDPASREAAVVTFLATASGVTLLGIGSAFWGLLAGVLTSVLASVGRRRRATASASPPHPPRIPPASPPHPPPAAGHGSLAHT
ncbi:benzoate/H(+) symporter BenE family transporter [Streptomyces sp. DT2A-34]|uniref:benzoate/H(+) symporter BenE family transporter n=1 Tax=Streptomyces sp. DT2A-34 TaxID=3051182 RepID=UPI00265C6B48|nr:benzoate/H(+) symporter BenE family transporter [Streptomyces sp. DT2A-34]MDO0911253.1 benzoate/H(+) symporter BenE family transporter [Streptomyces sp. DT2A-34]